jgi:hypothetical protein
MARARSPAEIVGLSPDPVVWVSAGFFEHPLKMTITPKNNVKKIAGNLNVVCINCLLF